MADITTTLATESSDAVKGFDKAAAAAQDYGREVDRAGDAARRAGRDLGGVAEAADATASASSQLAGGMGDLGGALAGMDGPLGAIGRAMEASQVAIMGVTGAADLLNVATEKAPGLLRKQKTAQAATTATTVAATGATRAATIATRLFSGALRTIPFLFIIGLIAVLVANWDKVVAVVQKVWNKIKDFSPAAVALVKAFGEGALGALRALGSFITDVLVIAIRGIVGAFRWVREKVAPIASAISAILGPIIDSIQWVIDNLSILPGGGAGMGIQAVPKDPRPVAQRAVQVNVSVPATANPAETGRQVAKALDAYFRAGGRVAIS